MNPRKAFEEAINKQAHERIVEARSYRLKRDVANKRGDSIESGSRVSLSWPGRSGARTELTDDAGNMVTVHTENLHNYVSGISRPPSIRVMEKWMFDGVAKSVTGKRVEPDGIGPDGAPSWMLVFGII